MRFQAVLFDFDGTLVDSEALHYQSWMKVLAPYQIDYTEHDFCDEFSGVPTLEAARILKERHQLASSARDLCDEKNVVFVSTAAEVLPRLMYFATQVVELTSKRCPIALVTGSSRAEALPVLRHYQLLELFSVIVCKDDVEQPKPHPEPYRKALAALDIAPHEAVAIEDTCTGLTSAKEAGLTAVVVPNMHSNKQDLSLADHSFTDLEAVFQWLCPER
ncbi:HAD family hydrolase [Pseudoalteromonas piscicida]|uniref:HAD family phosphatase n=1 Tax=Pseudoalteromonas piscicida TaxID=43662 RepID=A0AAD0W533_PSEO7|nr:HAD family phosphatase [Pseudoalteromonas piscicida]ASD66093.1 haloacid dehalogenase [Pseudoalteromonas piscicida]AXQ97018.1 HAD family phosphatase [Pseudoalteromonas piscicida]AXR03202.1 HAD family phosphatase [Pseudoalteromonas piscicida]